MNTIFSAIVATDKNRLIGKNNALPWHLPADLIHFKKITTGNTIIMGRKTFESLPNGALPNRRNIVLSHNCNLNAANIEVYNSMEHIIDAVK